MIRLALVGDVHGAFGSEDVATLDRGEDGQPYDRVLFVGDLAGYTFRGTLAVARQIAGLRTPALVMPGNHDAMSAPQMFAELTENAAGAAMLSGGEEKRVRALADALGPAELTGYRVHELAPGLSLVAARPHSFGGPRLAFQPYLSRAFGVASLEASAARLAALVDAARGPSLVLLGHNGPSGLGAARSALWGADFRREGGDFGDPDLRAAIAHARATGKRVLAVLAGHMHRQLRGGGPPRVAFARDEHGTLFVNAARVPRVFREGPRTLRHHVAVTVGPERAEAEDVLVEG
jgi:uncharacterized protein (TIGR04168 family)